MKALMTSTMSGVNISSSELEDDAAGKGDISSKMDNAEQTQCNNVDTTVLLIDYYLTNRKIIAKAVSNYV